MERYADGFERLLHFRDVFEGYFEKVEGNPDHYRRSATGLWSAQHEGYLMRFAVFEGRSSLKACDPTFDLNSTHVPEICDAIRDVFGNPFHPITVHPRWRSPAIMDLAASIYQACDFERLPALAEILTETGCVDELVLAHSRDGPKSRHMRGCWVLDLFLGDWYWARRHHSS
jgi:hypothetical protein